MANANLVTGIQMLHKDYAEIRRRYLKLGITPGPLMKRRLKTILDSAKLIPSVLPSLPSAIFPYTFGPPKDIEMIDFQHSTGKTFFKNEKGEPLAARLYKPAGKGKWPILAFDAGLRTGVIGIFELRPVAEIVARWGYVVYGTTSSLEVAHQEVDDYFAGIEHIRKNFDFVTDEVIATGLSSGGALSLGMAADEKAMKYGVRKVVAMSTYADLTEMYYYMCDYIKTHDPNDHRTKVLIDYKNYSEEVFKTPETAPDIYEAASPKNFIKNITVPILLLHGIRDSVVPVEQSEKLYKVAKQLGKDVKLRLLPGQTVHADLKEMLEIQEFIGMDSNIMDIYRFLKAK